MTYEQRGNVRKIRERCGEYMIVVSVDDVGFPRQILRPVRCNDALITQNLGVFPQQRCKDSNFVAATPQAQCEIDLSQSRCRNAHARNSLLQARASKTLLGAPRDLAWFVLQRAPAGRHSARTIERPLCQAPGLALAHVPRSRLPGRERDSRETHPALAMRPSAAANSTMATRPAANRIALAVITLPRRLAAARRPRPRLLAVRDGASGGDRSGRDRYRPPG